MKHLRPKIVSTLLVGRDQHLADPILDSIGRAPYTAFFRSLLARYPSVKHSRREAATLVAPLRLCAGRAIFIRHRRSQS
jgi:hypothetical protein